jgi:murein DD-endopeptidase MepM/ murein hydrolase activator NlpD
MGERSRVRCVLRIAAAIAFAVVLAACAVVAPTPAPLILKGGPSDMVGEPAAVHMVAARFAPPFRHRPEARQIVVRPGQSIGRLAEEYRVPVRAIIAANHLASPYKVETGQRLLIPGAAERPVETAALPAPAAREAAPEVIPLDGPVPTSRAAPKPVATAPPVPPTSAAAPRAATVEASAAEEARTESAERAPALPHGGQLPWPVRGRVLAGYGVGAGGRHNDGINIAAPRGAPVKSIEGGVVAYAGNELRGYGNLVLIKHPDGFISAYAHCEELLVKRGETVSRGQVIAKVGATGSVSEPQLHFELRRGERAVDPREFLAPAPSADGKGAAASG